MTGLQSKTGIRSEAYVRYVVCKEMGWDWYTYMAQPPFFIEEILLIMGQEQAKEKREMQTAERKGRMRRPTPHVGRRR